MPLADPSKAQNWGNNRTPNSPWCGNDGNLYFRGTDQRLNWISQTDSTQRGFVGDWACKSTPKTPEFGNTGFIYFQGTDDKLWKVRLKDADGDNLYAMKTSSSPDVQGDGFVYFQGTDNKLWQCPA
jgi:hypothetical protein